MWERGPHHDRNGLCRQSSVAGAQAGFVVIWFRRTCISWIPRLRDEAQSHRNISAVVAGISCSGLFSTVSESRGLCLLLSTRSVNIITQRHTQKILYWVPAKSAGLKNFLRCFFAQYP